MATSEVQYLGGYGGLPFGSEQVLDEFVNHAVYHVKLLGELAETQPQEVHDVFTKSCGIVSQHPYKLRTVRVSEEPLDLFGIAINSYLVPSLCSRLPPKPSWRAKHSCD